MKKVISLFILSLFFTIISCSKSADQTATSGTVSDSLVIMIENRITEKKRLLTLSSDLQNSRVGKSIKKYKPIIKKYAKRYGFDWRLIAAQIVQESGFKEKARSRVGARGLMQIMPRTAKELSGELNFEFIFKNPRENITAGIYHLKKQFRYFPESQFNDRTRLALASYNAGAGRVFDAQKITNYQKYSRNRWIYVRPNLSLLKKSDWQLHLQVWPDGSPKYGYFYGSDETIKYVDRIWNTYNLYKLIL